ncbi:MAG: hypothetical protein WAU69_02470, partial [Solirubrobacteraceae bacterium]
MREGLKADSWLAIDREEAARYGEVVAVDLAAVEGSWPRDESYPYLWSWQAHFPAAIPPSAIARLRFSEKGADDRG